MTINIESIKNSLRIDHNEDDSLLGTIIETAESYVFGAISASEDDYQTVSDYEQYEWAVSLLAQHWYLNRQEASAKHMPMTVLSLIQQMRGKYYANH